MSFHIVSEENRVANSKNNHISFMLSNYHDVNQFFNHCYRLDEKLYCVFKAYVSCSLDDDRLAVVVVEMTTRLVARPEDDDDDDEVHEETRDSAVGYHCH